MERRGEDWPQSWEGSGRESKGESGRHREGEIEGGKNTGAGWKLIIRLTSLIVGPKLPQLLGGIQGWTEEPSIWDPCRTDGDSPKGRVSVSVCVCVCVCVLQTCDIFIKKRMDR